MAHKDMSRTTRRGIKEHKHWNAVIKSNDGYEHPGTAISVTGETITEAKDLIKRDYGDVVVVSIEESDKELDADSLFDRLKDIQPVPMKESKVGDEDSGDDKKQCAKCGDFIPDGSKEELCKKCKLHCYENDKKVVKEGYNSTEAGKKEAMTYVGSNGLPKDSTLMGTITLKDNSKGALVELPTGKFAVIKNGKLTIVNLTESKVDEAAGRYGLKWIEANKEGEKFTKFKYFDDKLDRDTFVTQLRKRDNFVSVELEMDMKESKLKEALHLCNDCAKTFRSNESICPTCKKPAEKMVKEMGPEPRWFECQCCGKSKAEDKWDIDADMCSDCANCASIAAGEQPAEGSGYTEEEIERSREYMETLGDDEEVGESKLREDQDKPIDYQAMVQAVRSNAIVGKGSCSYTDETMEDSDLIKFFKDEGILSSDQAIAEILHLEDLWMENSLQHGDYDEEGNRNLQRFRKEANSWLKAHKRKSLDEDEGPSPDEAFPRVDTPRTEESVVPVKGGSELPQWVHQAIENYLTEVERNPKDFKRATVADVVDNVYSVRPNEADEFTPEFRFALEKEIKSYRIVKEAKAKVFGAIVWMDGSMQCVKVDGAISTQDAAKKVVQQFKNDLGVEDLGYFEVLATFPATDSVIQTYHKQLPARDIDIAQAYKVRDKILAMGGPTESKIKEGRYSISVEDKMTGRSGMVKKEGTIVTFDDKNEAEDYRKKLIASGGQMRHYTLYDRGSNESKIKEAKVKDFNVGDAYGVQDFPVKMVKTFIKGGDFDAINAARDYLREKGYVIGSMQSDSPIGFAKAETTQYIAKWRNIDDEDKTMLDGIIVPDDDFRDGGAKILFFHEQTNEALAPSPTSSGKPATDKRQIIAKAIVDKAEADRLAREKKGTVVQDSEDPKKWSVEVPIQA
jgi:hypothetical protein